jgi:hypothetical protein
MKLVQSVSDSIWKEFGSYEQVKHYIKKWHEDNYEPNGFNNNYWENFTVIEKEINKIDLSATLHSMPGTILLKIAIDLGVDTLPGLSLAQRNLDLKYSKHSACETNTINLL